MGARALLFDFDGTLVDTESVDLRSWQEVFRAHGVEVPLHRFALRIGTLGGPDELDALLDAARDRDAAEAERRGGELELLAEEPLRPGVRSYLEAASDLGAADLLVESLDALPLAELLELVETWR